MSERQRTETLALPMPDLWFDTWFEFSAGVATLISWVNLRLIQLRHVAELHELQLIDFAARIA